MFDYSKVYVFDSKKFGKVCIRAEENLCHSEVLKMYVDWYNKEFIPSEKELASLKSQINVTDFVFSESFHFLDFYSDKLTR